MGEARAPLDVNGYYYYYHQFTESISFSDRDPSSVPSYHLSSARIWSVRRRSRARGPCQQRYISFTV